MPRARLPSVSPCRSAPRRAPRSCYVRTHEATEVLAVCLYHKETEQVCHSPPSATRLFAAASPSPRCHAPAGRRAGLSRCSPLAGGGLDSLRSENRSADSDPPARIYPARGRGARLPPPFVVDSAAGGEEEIDLEERRASTSPPAAAAARSPVTVSSVPTKRRPFVSRLHSSFPPRRPRPPARRRGGQEEPPPPS